MEFMGTALAYIPEMIQPRMPREVAAPQWAVDVVGWLRLMVRQHRLICVGYEQLYKQMACDPVQVQTLDVMGIAAPDWGELFKPARIQCQGWDSRGVYFVSGRSGFDGCSVMDDMMFGRAWVVPKGEKFSGAGATFIDVPGVKGGARRR